MTRCAHWPTSTAPPTSTAATSRACQKRILSEDDDQRDAHHGLGRDHAHVPEAARTTPEHLGSSIADAGRLDENLKDRMQPSDDRFHSTMSLKKNLSAQSS